MVNKWNEKEIRMKGTNETFFYDNGGANFIMIRDYKDGTFKFEVGARCVMILRKTGTITEITDWLFEVATDKDGEIELLNGF